MVLAMGAAGAAAEDLLPGAVAVSDNDRAVPVRYADLDLSRADDAAALLSRLRSAAGRACAIDEVRRPGAALSRAMQDCREEAVARAVAQLNSPELTRLYAADTLP
jgi:UrcA family protein